MADFMQRSLLKQKNLTHSIMDVHDTMSESSEQNKKYIEEQLQIYQASYQLASRASVLTQSQCFLNAPHEDAKESSNESGQELFYSAQNIDVYGQDSLKSLSEDIYKDIDKKSQESNQNIESISQRVVSESKRLYVNGNILFQKLQENGLINILEMNFEHQFQNDQIQQNLDPLKFFKNDYIDQQHFLDEIELQIHQIILKAIKKQHPINLSDYIIINPNLNSFILRQLDDERSQYCIKPKTINIDMKPVNEGNEADYQVVSNLIGKTMFGVTLLKGPENLYCLSYVNWSRVENQRQQATEQLLDSKLNTNMKNEINYIREFSDQYSEQIKVDKNYLKSSLQEQIIKQENLLQENTIKMGVRSSDEQIYSKLSISKQTIGQNSEVIESFSISKNQIINLANPKEQFQFYIKRDENMFINDQMGESLTIGIDCVKNPSKNTGEDIKILAEKLNTQKLFMNMVIHDLRNPTESINEGLKQVKTLCQRELNQIIIQTNFVLKNKFLSIQPGKEQSVKSHRSTSQRSQQNLSPVHHARSLSQLTPQQKTLFLNFYTEKQKSYKSLKNQQLNQMIIDKLNDKPKLENKSQGKPNIQISKLNVQNKWMPNQPDTPAIKSIFAATEQEENKHNSTPQFNDRHEAGMIGKFSAFNKNKKKIVKEEKKEEEKFEEEKFEEEKKEQQIIQQKPGKNISQSSSSSREEKVEIVEQIKQRQKPKNKDSFGNMDQLPNIREKKNSEEEHPSGAFDCLVPPKSKTNKKKEQCGQIIEEANENSSQNSNSKKVKLKQSNQEQKINLIKSRELKSEDIESKDKIIIQNQILNNNSQLINQAQDIIQNEEDPFSVFEDVEEDDFDEFSNVPNHDSNSINDQIGQQMKSINALPSLQAQDNNVILHHKNTVQPLIKIVEKLVYFQDKETQDDETQTKLAIMIDQDVQCSSQNKQLLESFEKASLDEDEQSFFKEMLRNKELLKTVMENFKDVGQQFVNKKMSKKLPSQPIIKSRTEKLIDASPKSVKVKTEQNISKLDLLQNSTQHCFSCRQCFKISKFMIKQLEKVLKLNLKVDQYIKNAIYSSLMMNNLINDLLDQSKMEQQKFELDLDYFNMFEIITQAFQILSFQADMKKIGFHLYFDKSKPYIFCKILNDKRRFLQILINFISNSLKFTSKNGIIKVHLIVLQEQVTQNNSLTQKRSNPSSNKLSERLGSRKTLRSCSVYNSSIKHNLINGTVEVHKYMQIQIIVEDNGVGIKKENIGKLFMDYNKLNEHKKMNTKGTGLGLSICKNIINKMGGQVVVESEEGVGSKFIITLQVKAVDQQLVNADYFKMTQLEKDNHYKESGAYNFFPEFNNKYNFINQDSSNGKISQISAQKSAKNQDSSNESFEINYLQIPQKFVLYKFETNKIIDYTKQDDMNNFKILNDMRELVIKKYAQSKFQKSNESNLDAQSYMVPKSKKYKTNSRKPKGTRRANSQIGFENQLYVEDSSVSHRKKSIPQKEPSSKNNNKQIQLNNKNLTQKVQHVNQLDQFINENLLQSSNKYMIFQSSASESEQQLQFDSRKERDDKRKESVDSSISQMLSSSEQLHIDVTERKINCLIANDQEFSLLIISQMLQGLKFIGKTDQATNGQEALEKVQYSENTSDELQFQYDIIFLDLDMPILNGYEACHQIKEFYESSKIRYSGKSNNLIKQGQIQEYSIQSKHLEIMRFKQMIDDYINLSSKNVGPFNGNFKKLIAQNVIRTTYQKVKYWCLDNLKRPYIFAYSALINEEVRKKTIEAGFDGCLISPITVESVQYLMCNYIDKYVTQFISQQLLNQQQNQILNMILNNNNSPINNIQNNRQQRKASTIMEEDYLASDPNYGSEVIKSKQLNASGSIENIEKKKEVVHVQQIQEMSMSSLGGSSMPAVLESQKNSNNNFDSDDQIHQN